MTILTIPPKFTTQSTMTKQTTNRQEMKAATFPEPTLAVRRLADPLVEKLGHTLRSEYVERYWLSVLGPSATLLIRRLAEGLSETSDGYTVDMAELSMQLGLGHKSGKNSPLWRSVERLCRFDVAKRNKDTLALRVALPNLPLRYAKRLTEQLQAEHELALASRPTVWSCD